MPVEDLIISGTEPVSLRPSRGSVASLRNWGWLKWTSSIGHGPCTGSARITSGSSAVELRSWAGVDLRSFLKAKLTLEPESLIDLLCSPQWP